VGQRAGQSPQPEYRMAFRTRRKTPCLPPDLHHTWNSTRFVPSVEFNKTFW